MSDIINRLRALRGDWIGDGIQPRINRAEVIDEIARLRAELAAVRADAERIDYIEQQARCDPKMDGQHVWWPTSFRHRLIGPTLRAAIDAARGGQQ